MLLMRDYVRHLRREMKALREAADRGEHYLYDDFEYMRLRKRWASLDEYLKFKKMPQVYLA